MARHWLIIFFLAALGFQVRAQSHFSISGYVTDSATGEALIGASVFIQEIGKGVPTNTYGYYSASLPQGRYTLVVRYMGYADLIRAVNLDQDRKLNLKLSSTAVVMQAVEVTGERSKSQVESTDMGRMDLDVQKLQTLPALMGEVDILKTLQYLPGVQSNGEGNSGFYVRGGGPDQNLILLDGATVYNASHLFGFFSVFNADAVKDIELIKGGMPAQYGGRSSSVLDITMKEGNNKQLHGQGGIGLISSRLTLEGPIINEKSSFIVSARRTYIDVLVKPFVNPESRFAGSGYYFYDINAKANYRLSDKDRFFISGYFGRDVFNLNGNQPGSPNFKIPWGNATVTGRWNHVFGPKLFLNTTAVASDYKFSFGGGQDQFGFSLRSGIRDYGLKVDLNHYPDIRHNVRYGAQYTYHIYTPSTVEVNSGDVDFNIDTPSKLRAHEAGLYVQDDFDITDQLRLNAGLRFSWFAHIGPYREYITDAQGNTTGTFEHGSGKSIAQYNGLEPRASMRYTLNKNNSIKASFNRNLQYVHLASFSSIGLPTDTWIPSGKNVKPQEAIQYAAGWFRDLKQRTYEASIEVYYKDMANQIEFAEGMSPQDGGNANYDFGLVYGKGWSYGAELFIKRRYGKLTGWVGYTWSKTERKFPDINNGEAFPSRWDRRHDVNLVAGYELNDRWTLGGTFVYSTGQATTLPVQRYFIEGRLVSQFTARNAFRMAAFHRLDLSATLKNKATRTITDKGTGETSTVERKYRSSWTFSIYNVYNRYNPYFIYFAQESTTGLEGLQLSAKQVSLFGILPSVTWNFEF
ncbi:MAG TPA: TonB-dependent receptor [Flavobacteriales bacterium]|nr:TonB-dependent receptor [Flavobacteriales bacterium]